MMQLPHLAQCTRIAHSCCRVPRPLAPSCQQPLLIQHAVRSGVVYSSCVLLWPTGDLGSILAIKLWHESGGRSSFWTSNKWCLARVEIENKVKGLRWVMMVVVAVVMMGLKLYKEVVILEMASNGFDA